MIDKIPLLIVRFYFTINKILARFSFLSLLTPKKYINNIICKKNKNKYGLNNSDLYNLDQNISLILAAKLERFSKIVSSYPVERYLNLNAYKKEIKSIADNLKNITGSANTLEIRERYHQLIESGADEKLILNKEKELRKSENKDIAKAKASIIWIGNNLEYLWE